MIHIAYLLHPNGFRQNGTPFAIDEIVEAAQVRSVVRWRTSGRFDQRSRTRSTEFSETSSFGSLKSISRHTPCPGAPLQAQPILSLTNVVRLHPCLSDLALGYPNLRHGVIVPKVGPAPRQDIKSGAIRVIPK
jgi:hypothetical protein